MSHPTTSSHPTLTFPPHRLVAREITQNSTVIPIRPQIALKAREVIQKALMDGTQVETIEMALTKLLSNFNYLWGWGRYKDKWVGVTVGLLNEMMAVLKGMRLPLPLPVASIGGRKYL